MPAIGEAKKRYYPGLNEVSVALWRKWLELYEDRFDTFYYNVRVGQGIAPLAGATPEMKKVWYAVTSKRIDVVAERENQTWVIEIEDRPGLRTIGQVVGYLHLLPKYQGSGSALVGYLDEIGASEFLLPTPIREVLIGAVISARMGYDMAEIFAKQTVLYFVFPPSGYPKLPPQFLPSTQTPLWYPGAK